MEDFEGALEVETLPGPMVQGVDNAAQSLGGDLREVSALGQVLAQEAVGVLVGASLPGMVGMSEVDEQVQPLFQFERTGEFASVVQRQTVAFLSGQSAERSPELLGDRLGGAGVDLSRDNVAAGPIHTGDEVSRASFADDGVAFPIAESRSFVGLFRPFVDGSFAQDLALARGLAVGLAAGFSGDPQEGTELPRSLGIGPDPAIDRRMADRKALQTRRSTGRHASGDLLRRPVVRQTLADVGHQAVMTGLEPTQMGPSSAVGPRLCMAWLIAALDRAIACALPADGAAMAAQAAGDLGMGIALESHSVDDISFVHGKMAVRHREHSVV